MLFPESTDKYYSRKNQERNTTTKGTKTIRTREFNEANIKQTIEDSTNALILYETRNTRTDTSKQEQSERNKQLNCLK